VRHNHRSSATLNDGKQRSNGGVNAKTVDDRTPPNDVVVDAHQNDGTAKLGILMIVFFVQVSRL